MQPLILLHGALGHAVQLNPLADLLKEHYQSHTINFHGHGGAAMPDAEFTIVSLAGQVLEYMQTHKLESANIFGYSMGGYVAMYLAKYHPQKVRKVITLATKYAWSEAIAEKETKMLDPEQTLTKVPAFAQLLRERHADWKQLMTKTASMLTDLGMNNLLQDISGITPPCLILLGDRDKMITLEETVNTYQSLPNASMGMLPGTGHVIEKVNWNLLKTLIVDFIGC